MRLAALAGLGLLAACRAGAIRVPGIETPYVQEQMRLARSRPMGAQTAEAQVLQRAAQALKPLSDEESARIHRQDEVEGLLDLDAAGARDFVSAVGHPEKGDAVIAATPLGLETVLLAAYARNPDVIAARNERRAAVAMFDQATYLEAVLLRYRAFAGTSPSAAGGGMRESAFPYPGVVALKGEMIAKEVAMARERARTRVRDVLVRAAKAYLGATHHEEEIRIRQEQLALADRLLAGARALTRGGKGTQAELLEAEAERSEAANMVQHATAARARYLAELNAVLNRSPAAALTLTLIGDPPPATPAAGPYLDLALRFSSEVRLARLEIERQDVAIRMAEAMLFRPPGPGALGGASTMPAGEEAGAPASPSPSPSPTAFGPELAWVRELRERRAALSAAADEAVRATEQKVAAALFEVDGARRKFAVAAKTSVPLSKQAVDERVRLYEAGREEFTALIGSYRRYLDARHEAVAGRYEYAEAETQTWEATGARLSVAGAREPAGDGR